MGTTPSQKTMTFEAFKEELEFADTTLIKMPEEQLNARNAPTAFNHDDLVQQIKQRMPQDEYVVQPKPVKIPAGLGPYFYKLPRELRDQIFSHLLASGHPNFMRTSRAMRQEGKIWVAREGVYRMNLGFYYRFNCQKPSQEIIATIQNVNICINSDAIATSSVDVHSELLLLDIFAGPVPHRQTCKICLEFHSAGLVVIGGREVLSRLQHFRGFEKVVLRIRINWEGALFIRALSDAWLFFPYQTLSMYRGVEQARDFLVPHLGETELISDKDGWSMEFYPRKTQEEAPIVGSGGRSTG